MPIDTGLNEAVHKPPIQRSESGLAARVLKEIAVQLYLHSREAANGYFLFRVISSKESNRQTFISLKLPHKAEELFSMTPQEELFADFFKKEKIFIKDFDNLTLEAHREELSRIAFEARARLTAIDDEKRSRKAPMKGFQAAIHVDETTANAINKIKERGTKLSKEERLIENMMKLPGMDRASAERLVSAGAVKAQLDSKFGKSDNGDSNLPFKPINPFAAVPTPAPDVQIVEDTNAVIITNIAADKVDSSSTKDAAPKIPFSFVNPFDKKG